MAKIELNIVALGDFSSINSQIKALQSQVALLNQSMGNVSLSSNISNQLKSVTSEFSQSLAAAGQFKLTTVQASTELENFGTNLQKGSLGLKNYFQIVTNQTGSATNSVKQLAVEQTKLQNSVIMADPTKQGFYSVFTPTSIDEVANATKIAANEANIYAIAVNKGSQALINWGKNTQWAGRQLTVGMSIPLLLFGSQAVSAFDSVNAALTQLQKVYGEGLNPPSQNSINQISQQVLDLGKSMASTLGISQEFTVQVATQFAAMGKQGNDLINLTQQTDRLAKLGNLDQQTATNAMIALQNVYKLNTEQTADAVNYFGSIQKQTSLSMTDLVSAESKVGPVIDQLGGSYKDTSIMLLAMKEAGVPAAQAANALKSAFASIISPTKAATTEFAAFGINLANIKNAGGPVQMIEALQAGLLKLQPLAREQLIEKLFGKYQFSRMSALIDNFNQGTSQTVNAIKVANASSQQLQTLANQELTQATSSPSAQWQKAVATIKADLYPVGQKIIELGTKLLNFGNSIAKLFSGLPGPLKSVMGALAVGVALSGPIIMLTGLMGNFIGYLVRGVFNIKQLATGGKTLGQLLTPELLAAQNANSLFNEGLVSSVDEVDLLTAAIKQLTDSLSGLVDTMNVGAGVSDLTSAVGAVATAETRIYEQMSIPGFASGGVVPGSGNGDTVPIMATPGEVVLSKPTVARYGAFINGMLNNNLPGYAEGGLVSGHASMPFAPSTIQYQNMMTKYPSLVDLQKELPGSVKVLSNLVADIPQKLNTDLRSGVATPEAFASGWEKGGGSKFAKAAALGGLSSGDASNPEISKALADFETELKKRVLSLNKATLSDQDLADETRRLIDEQKNATGATGKVARALDNASQQVGQVRVNAGADYVRSGLESGQLTKRGTLAYLNEVPVGQVRNKDNKVTDYALNQGSNYQKLSVSAKSVVDKIKSTMKQAAGIASPAQEFNEQVGKPIAQGVQEGIQETLPGMEAIIGDSLNASAKELAASTQADWNLLGKDMSSAVAKGITQGTPEVVAATETQADEVLAAQSGSSGMIGKVKGMFTKEGGGMNMGAKMMGSMALMTAGPMLANMLPKGSNIQGMTSEASSMAGMGMMFGPEGAAAGAALGVVISGFGDLMKAEKEHQVTVKATFSESDAAIKMFGGTVTSTTIPIIHFSQQLESAGITSKTALTQIQQMSNSIAQLSSSDPMKKTADAIKSYGNNIGGVVGTLKQFAAAQVASGMDPKGVKNMVAAMLQYSGQTQYLQAALKEIVPATKDVATAQSTLIDKLVSAEGASNAEYQANMLLGGSYKDLDSGSKNLADGLSTVAMGMFSTTANSTVLTATVKNLNNTQVDAYTSGTLLAAKLKDMGQTDLASRLLQINSYVKNTGVSFLLATAQADGFAASLDEIKYAASNPQGLAELTDQATKFVAAFNAAALKQAVDAAAAAAKEMQKTLGLAASGTDAVSTLTAAYKSIIDPATKYTNELDKQQTLLNAQNTAAKDALDYATKQADLQNQITQKMATGDYLGANLIKQNMLSNTNDYQMQTAQNANQQIIDTGKQAISDAQAAIASGIAPDKNTIALLKQYTQANGPKLNQYSYGTINVPGSASYGTNAQMGVNNSAVPPIQVVVNGSNLTQEQLQAAATTAALNAYKTIQQRSGMSSSTTKVGNG
jgi:TP901 family phage tail tape measure protein